MVYLSLVKVKGVVIKSIDYRENDKLVWIYTEELGKISTIVKGAKKSKNKNFALTLPLSYGEYVFFKGRNLYNLQEGRLINSFQSLLNNFDKLTYSSYLCELIDICVEDKEINKYLYKEFIVCLYLLETDALDYEILIRSFEIRLLRSTGYGINLDNCCFCRKPISVANYISLSHHGGVCEECKKEHGLFISRAGYNAMKFLGKTSMDKVYRLNISEEVKKEIARVTTFFISSNYSKKPKSLEMLNYMKE